jgi:hypothetical protein
MILLPYDRAGCWSRIESFLLSWARRLVWVLVGFVIGFWVHSCV